METLVRYLDGEAVTNLPDIRAELVAELNRSKDKAAANRALYEEYHDKVMQALAEASSAVSAQEIADETGVARGKVVYGLNNYWKSEVKRDDSGKVTLYSLA